MWYSFPFEPPPPPNKIQLRLTGSFKGAIRDNCFKEQSLLPRFYI